MPAQIYMCYRTASLSNDGSEDQQYLTQDNPHFSSGVIHAGVPYIMRSKSAQPPSLQLQSELRSLLALPIAQRRQIASLNAQLGNDVMLGFAELFETDIYPGAQRLNKVVGTEANISGAGVTQLGKRESLFQKLLSEYQKSLERVRQGHKQKLPKHEMVKLENHARRLHEQLNTSFRQELTRLAQKVKSRRGTAFSNAERGIHQAKSARTSAPIQVSNSNELSLIKNMSKGLKYGGRALLVYDVANRGMMVYHDYNTGKDWERTAIVQGSGLAASAAFGSVTAFTTSALTIGLAATPIGWVIAIGIGVTATYLVSTEADQLAQHYVASKYDEYR